MANSIYDLSVTASSNTTIDSVDVSGTTGKVKDGDNVMRSLGAFMAQKLQDDGGVKTTSGSANAQTVTLASGFSAYATGQTFTVKLGYTNTSTTVTLNVNSIGAKSVKVNYDGLLADPIPGDLRKGAYGHFIYDGTYLVLLNAQQQARYAPGTLYGLTLSNNASDATNDIDIAVGSARSSDDSANMDLLSALTKRLDASWAVGSGNGGLDTGSIANTTYHVWLIKRSDTGVVDALFSTSATSPTMPTNYDLKRRIGSIIRSSGAIRAFKQTGNTFRLVSAARDRNSTSGSSVALLTLTVPTGIPVQPLLWVGLDGNTSATSIYLGSASFGGDDGNAIAFVSGSGTLRYYLPPNWTTNTSAQLYFTQINSSGTPFTSFLDTVGWIDLRT